MTAIETLYEWRALISTMHLCDKFKDILLDLNVGEAIGDTRSTYWIYVIPTRGDHSMDNVVTQVRRSLITFLGTDKLPSDVEVVTGSYIDE